MKYENFKEAMRLKAEIDKVQKLKNELTYNPVVKVETRSGFEVIKLYPGHEGTYEGAAGDFLTDLTEQVEARLSSLMAELERL